MGPDPHDYIPNLGDGAGPAKKPQACVLVIFGASGDLTKRKLIPALYNLALENRLPERFAVVGYARSEMGDEVFRQKCGTLSKNFPAPVSKTNPFGSSLLQPFITFVVAMNKRTAFRD